MKKERKKENNFAVKDDYHGRRGEEAENDAIWGSKVEKERKKPNKCKYLISAERLEKKKKKQDPRQMSCHGYHVSGCFW